MTVYISVKNRTQGKNVYKWIKYISDILMYKEWCTKNF